MDSIKKFPVSILCVDDEPMNLDILNRHLSKSVNAMYTAQNGNKGYEMFLEKRPDIIITDLFMPELNGLEMSKMIRSVDPKIPIILLTSCNSMDFLAEAIDIGVTQFLQKPILREKLFIAMQRCYETIYLQSRLIEEHERAEAHLLSSQKLESLGVLAGGIAHNFNNILTAIIGNVAIAVMKLPKDSPAIKFMKNVESSAMQAAEIAKQMLDYSGHGGVMLVKIKFNELIDSMNQQIKAIIPNNINLIINNPDFSFPIKCDKAQIRQVIKNILVNALEAIDKVEGKIEITTGSMKCSRDYLESCCFDDVAIEGDYAFLEISDTGCGMNQETVAKIFDPFFSTKFTGRGLGMAAVLGILKWHNGTINIISKESEGSSVRILIPEYSEEITKETEVYHA